MCWRDSILGKFQLSGFFFFNRINPIFIPFRVSNIFKTKAKKPRSTITYNEDLDEEQKMSFFFSFSFIYYYYFSFFSRSILAIQTNLIFKIHLSHSKPILTLSSRNAISVVEFDSLQIAIKLNPPMTFKKKWLWNPLKLLSSKLY